MVGLRFYNPCSLWDWDFEIPSSAAMARKVLPSTSCICLMAAICRASSLSISGGSKGTEPSRHVTVRKAGLPPLFIPRRRAGARRAFPTVSHIGSYLFIYLVSNPLDGILSRSKLTGFEKFGLSRFSLSRALPAKAGGNL